MSFPFARFLVPIFVLAALVAACSGGDDDPDPTATAAATGSTGSTGATGGTGSQTGASIDSYTDVQQAVIQVVAKGTFRDPEVGLANGSGAGSGFIISSDGLAVTNNHVVAGAATLEVFIGGNSSKSYNATIVGVSECNDLALIDIRESDPLPYLDWYEENIVPGVDVYAAGFPLGDPQFTLTHGIVSKAEADGETIWASIDHTIEHDANIQPGNSGGPLVSTDGKVVAVNYASGQYTNTSQFFAIASALAKPVIESLKDGDFEALGVNGWAVYDEVLGISGIWVAGVAAGSAASDAGLLPGDIITTLNGLPLGLDGTMSDYCDVIRTAGEGRPMTIEILRYDTGEILRGEINGDTPIEIVFSPATVIQEEVNATPSSGTQAGYSGYVSIYDDTDTIIVDIPVEWDDINTRPLDFEGQQLPYVAAATDLDGFFDTYNTSGMVFVLFGADQDVQGLLADYEYSGGCLDGGVYEYSDPVFTGLYQIWEDCGNNSTYTVVLAAVPENGGYTALMIVAIAIEADWDALDELFATFNVLQ